MLAIIRKRSFLDSRPRPATSSAPEARSISPIAGVGWRYILTLQAGKNGNPAVGSGGVPQCSPSSGDQVRSESNLTRNRCRCLALLARAHSDPKGKKAIRFWCQMAAVADSPARMPYRDAEHLAQYGSQCLPRLPQCRAGLYDRARIDQQKDRRTEP